MNLNPTWQAHTGFTFPTTLQTMFYSNASPAKPADTGYTGCLAGNQTKAKTISMGILKPPYP